MEGIEWMKVLAVIIPGYNCEKYIDRCMSSILSQLGEGMMIYFIDDGSTDNTRSLVTPYLTGGGYSTYFRRTMELVLPGMQA